MKYNNYNPEKKTKSRRDIYIKAAIIGSLLALSLIISGKLFIFVVTLIIKYWTWTIGIIVGILLIKYLFGKRNKPKGKYKRPDYTTWE